ncbi:MAG: hypothetical protein LBH00_10925 [Planctomycetaceae bacterium]|jgi:hypothetical protein|nr:hypothetical protein [Planctomycetaceae bacterium]
MFCFLLAVIVFCSGVLLYLAYRDQKQEENSYRTNALHICRIEVLEERDFLSASPLDDSCDYYEPPYNPCNSYMEYNTYTDTAAPQNNDPDEEFSGDYYESLFNSGNDNLEDNTGSNAVARQNTPQNSAVPAVTSAPIYTHDLLGEGTSRVTTAGNYYTLTADYLAAKNFNSNTLDLLHSATSLTIAATFNVDSVNGWHYIAAHDCPNNTGAEVFLRIRDGKLQFGYWDTYQNHLAETAVSANTWYSVAGTFDGTTWKLYVNGEVRDTETYTPPNSILNLDVRGNGSTSSWFVGRHGTPTDLRIFGGNLYRVEIWDTALSADEIAAQVKWTTTVKATAPYSKTEGLNTFWGSTETNVTASFSEGIFQIAYTQTIVDNFTVTDKIQPTTMVIESASDLLTLSVKGIIKTVTNINISYNTATAEWTLFYSVSTSDTAGYVVEDRQIDGDSVIVLSEPILASTAKSSGTLHETVTTNGGKPAASQVSKWIDWVQEGISWTGFLPGVGAIPDLVNAGIYAARGKYAEASMSALSAAPAAGDSIAAARKVKKITETIKDVAVKKIDDAAGDVVLGNLKDIPEAVLKKNGIKDIHAFKKEYVGRDVSEFDIKLNSKTRELIIVPHHKEVKIPPIRTGVFING